MIYFEYHPMLLFFDRKLFTKITKQAKEEKRKNGPMAVVLLRRYFEMTEERKDGTQNG